MWDYDKLFAEGNIVGLKNLHNNKIYNHGIPNRNCWGDTNEVDWYCFENNNLKRNMLEIQYIIRLDEHGNVVERLFDRDRDMKSKHEPMPELETGMFVKCYSPYRNENSLGLIYDNRVIYQNGEWDEIYDLTEDVVMEVYSNKALCFNNCQEPYLLWHNPKYLTKSN